MIDAQALQAFSVDEDPCYEHLVGPNVWKVLKEIEALCESWVVNGVPTAEHSYGRLPGEEEIRAWSIPRTTGVLLFMLAEMNSVQNGLEIGTSLAYSTIWLAAAIAANGGTLHSCELFPAKLTLARRHILASGLQNIHILEGDARATLADWSSPLDLVFLDADPQNYGEYWELLSPSVESGGLLVMDNAIDHGRLTSPLIDRVRADRAWKIWILPIDHGLLVAQRR